MIRYSVSISSLLRENCPNMECTESSYSDTLCAFQWNSVPISPNSKVT